MMSVMRNPENLVGLLEKFFGLRYVVVEIFAHAYCLGSLTGGIRMRVS